MSTQCPKCNTENTEDSQFCKKCATPLEADVVHTKTIEKPTEELKRGSVFAGRYEIIEELGKGGMGKVYRVEDTKVKEEIALKLIKPEIAADKKTIERFRNELKTARRIRHKNVCAMFDLSEEKGSHFITMEYVSGGDLKKFIRRSGHLNVGKAISIAKQICEGLEEAHSLGIVHRDLKPNNIMIDDNGNARIMDFGIARTVKEKGITGSGVIIGTPEYMSPEQAEAKEVDHRSDIYSLGVILYEMTTGRLPFEGDTSLAVAMKHKGEIPKDPREFNSQISDDLSRVILKCLEKDKGERHKNAEEVRTELMKIEQGLSTSDRVAPERKTITSKEITVTLGLKRALIPSGLAVVILIALLFVWSPWRQRTQTPIKQEKPSIAVLPFEDLSLTKDQESFCDGLATSIINSLSGIEELSVRARGSSFSFKGKNLELKEIGRQLNVDTILDGTVQKEGNRIRLFVQLNNVSDESLLWSKRFDSELADTFDIQDEISLAIIDNLQLQLLGREKERVTKRHTEDIEAFSLYSNGLYWWNKRTGEGMFKAIEYFEQAIAIDQNYALAYVGLADSYNLLNFYADVPTKDCYPKAKAAALKALKIDDTLGEAYNSLGYYRERYEWDIPGAEKEFKRAVEFSPNYATAHFWYGELLLLAGRFEEAVQEVEIAADFDPVSKIINSQLGWTYIIAGRIDQAKSQIKKSLEMDPNFAMAHLMQGIMYLKEKNYQGAIQHLEKCSELSGRSANSLAYLGYAYALNNQQDKARKIIDEINTYSKVNIAPIYVGLGEYEKALDSLEQGYEERSEFIVFLNSDEIAWWYAPLFSHPRYQALLRKVGFRD